jgi:hypothetical protein
MQCGYPISPLAMDYESIHMHGMATIWMMLEASLNGQNMDALPQNAGNSGRMHFDIAF